jgi:hypothetical protein
MSSKAAYDLAGIFQHVVTLPAHAAATASEKLKIFEAPVDCTVTSVEFVSAIAVTGVDTNTTHLNLIDGGAAGAGSTEVGNYDLTDGNDLAANTAQELAGAAGAGTDFDLDEGDYLMLQWEKVGNGLNVPIASVTVHWRAQ